MPRSTRRNTKSHKNTRGRKNLSMTRPKKRTYKMKSKRRTSKKNRTRRFKKRGGMDPVVPRPPTDVFRPDRLKADLSQYGETITAIVHNDQLTKEEKIARLEEVGIAINMIQKTIPEANKLEVNRIFEDYIGENGRIYDAITGLEMDEEYHTTAAHREEEEALELTPLRQTGYQPKTGQLERR